MKKNTLLTMMGSSKGSFIQDFSTDTTLGNFIIAGSAAVVSDKLQITPTLGTERVGDPSFDADAYWLKQAGWSVTGSQAVFSATGSVSNIYRANIFSDNIWHHFELDVASISDGPLKLYNNYLKNFTTTATGTFTGSVSRNADTVLYMEAGTATNCALNSVSAKPITFNTMLALYKYRLSSNIIAKASVTLADTTLKAEERAGVIICVDDLTTPTDGLIATVTGQAAFLHKVVAGAYTDQPVIEGAITYVAGANIEIRKNGTAVDLFYNDIAVGTTQTITDAGLITNQYAGIFASDVSAQIGSVSLKKG